MALLLILKNNNAIRLIQNVRMCKQKLMDIHYPHLCIYAGIYTAQPKKNKQIKKN